MSRRRRWKENKRLSRAFRVTWRLTFVQRELVRSRSRINTIEGKKEKEEERKKSESRSIDRSILRFGWCAIARRLSLTASTSASTSRSLHTDRGICYLVFATTRSEALARVASHTLLPVSLYLEPSLPGLLLPPPSFPTEDGGNPVNLFSGPLLSPPPPLSPTIHFLSPRIRILGTREKKFPSPPPLPRPSLLSSSSTRTKERTRSSPPLRFPSYPPGSSQGRFKYRRGSFSFLFLSLAKRRSSHSSSLSLSRRNNRHAIDYSGEGRARDTDRPLRFVYSSSLVRVNPTETNENVNGRKIASSLSFDASSLSQPFSHPSPHLSLTPSPPSLSIHSAQRPSISLRISRWAGRTSADTDRSAAVVSPLVTIPSR